MPVMDEFKEEREKIKNASFKDKVNYFVYYYKWHVVVVAAVIIVAAIWIHDVLNQKETAFFAVLLNNVALEQENVDAFRSDFIEYSGIDAETYNVLFDNTIRIDSYSTDELSVSSSQRMMAYTAAGELDIIIGGSDIFSDYSYNSMLYDLREVLSDEQIAAYEPYFYYIDQTVVDALYEAQDNPIDSVMPEIPDPSKPEEMENPIPVGFFVQDCKKLSDSYYFTGEEYTAVGIMVNAPHLENALSFIDYLFR